MSSHDQHHGIIHGPQLSPGPYLLQELINDVSLSAEEGGEAPKDASITCVEHYDDNLYIGSSNGLLLHYVALPASDDADDPTRVWIQASKRSLLGSDNVKSNGQDPSVKQILILPETGKAFVLCHGGVTICTLPELSPTLTTAAARLTDCTWLGGLDANDELPNFERLNKNVIMICQKSRLRLVKIGDRLSQVREIGLGGCLAAARRGDIACVADSTSYSLLDIVEQQRIPLFDISSGVTDDIEANEQRDQPNISANSSHGPGHKTGSDGLSAPHDDHEHSSTVSDDRSDTQAGSGSPEQGQPESDNIGSVTQVRQHPPRQSSLAPHDVPEAHGIEQAKDDVASKGVSQVDSRVSSRRPSRSPQPRRTIDPIILSPSIDRFLLTRGTSIEEPGIGMLVNLDGDVVPPTVDFSTLPTSICLHDPRTGSDAVPQQAESSSDCHILALVRRRAGDDAELALEVQKLDLDTQGLDNAKHYIRLGPPSRAAAVRASHSILTYKLPEVAKLLASCKMELGLPLEHAPATDGSQAARSQEREKNEFDFVGRLARFETDILAWNGKNIWSVAPNPEILRTEAFLSGAMEISKHSFNLDRARIESILDDFRDREPNGELEFFTLTYIRQKASLILFADLLYQATRNIMLYERDLQGTSASLTTGEIDPRIILGLVPLLKEEVKVGVSGLWAQAGLQDVYKSALDCIGPIDDLPNFGKSGHGILILLKEYLIFWRRKKGFGSVVDEKEVFFSVDAALIRLFLRLDEKSPRGPAKKGSIRAEFNTIIDTGVDCFERAVSLLEASKRLYLLSRLYQSRKMAREVLGIWRRIVEGEPDMGGEFSNGEMTVRNYLTKINDARLVEEYGSWLAQRDPKLGVQVFADRSSKIKFQPKQAVTILQERAPQAVKVFLEYLVFENNLSAYADDLISYYLDSVLDQLDRSQDSRQLLLTSYVKYKEQQAPKPTYSQFAENMDVDADWWRNRSRLLQLLGGSHSAASQYDVSGMLSRIQKYEQELVPEVIVLAGRQGHHDEAVRLLVHGLGDYDTAVTYCVRGGTSTYSPLTGSSMKETAPSRHEQETLFRHLLHEFLELEEPEDRIAQSSELLERFGPWYDPIEVVDMIPATWSVDLVCGFIETSLRHLITERNESTITKALLSSDNLNANVQLIEKLELSHPRVEEVSVDAR